VEQAGKYFLSAAAEQLPLNQLAHLGIIDVPFDRTFNPGAVVTRQELVQTAARTAKPALRIHNAPVVTAVPQKYTYQRLTADVHALAAAYPDLISLVEIGQSVEGRAIYALRLGHGTKEIFLDAAIHASEWLTTNLLMKMAEEYARHAQYDRPFGPYHVAEILEEVSLWFMPMLNPDGVTLVLEGPEAVQNSTFAKQLLQQANENSFSSWKANIRGVDLNRQFPAFWSRLVNVQPRPAPSHFKGTKPLSEPEAQSLYDFTLQRRPAMVISFHQQGEIIYWYNRQSGARYNRDRQLARQLAALTGYGAGQQLVNGGKYMDWAISELGIPAFIIEVGTVVGDLRQWERIWRQNRYVALEAARLILALE